MDEQSLIALIDDDESIRKSLARLIISAGHQVKAFASAAEFLDSAKNEMASCVVSDLRMPLVNGLQLQEALRIKAPCASIVFITGHGDIPATVSAMKAGAVDFLEKPIKADVLLEAIGRAIQRSNQMKAAAAALDHLQSCYEELTPREREVCALVSAGLLNKQVGAELAVTEKTVKEHRGRVMRKMKAESLADLVLMAERLGIRPADVSFAEAKGKLSSSAGSRSVVQRQPPIVVR
ncbi:MAG TPA: response regulator [Candidatus Binataceae bacterium]|jgi:FixJ family two-component response regulator|nr:response regulator [Candidatus Binataceae bacterium]